MQNLLTRSISGAVYVTLVMLAVFSGPKGHIGLAAVLSILAVLEWMQFGPYRIQWFTTLFIISAIFISLYLFSGVFDVSYMGTQLLLGLLAVSIVGVLLSQAFHKKAMSNKLFHSSFALIYIGIPMIVLPIIPQYQGQNHAWMLASVFILIWCNDTLAYLVGSLLGRHKLFPRISPNKTWEGFWGGVAGTLGGALAFHSFFPYMPLVGWLGLAAVVLLAGTLGDLFESAVKRSFGLKDSGAFMPGHGGILDRIDSLLFALPMAYFYLRIFENLH